jgi:RNA polymerase sigma factor (sigma-70 family)
MAQLAESDAKHLMKVVRRHLADYRQHCDFDDLLGEAFLRMVLALRDYQGAASREAVACRVARNAALAYLKSSRSRLCGLTRIGSAACRAVSWEDAPLWARVQPDFAPALIERLDRQALWREVWEQATPSQRQALWAYCCAGLPPSEIARRWGTTVSAVWDRLYRVAESYRQRHGLPARVKRAERKPRWGGGRDPEKARERYRRYYWRKKEREKQNAHP